MRPEDPSEPLVEVVTRADLARELTALRVSSGLTVRELARRLGTPVATIGDYFSGRHLPGPSQQQLFSALLEQCGVGEHELSGWLAALARVRLGSDGRLTRLACPYRGLEAFQAQDHELFFGRETATAELHALLRSLATQAEATSRLVILLGASGSGKSSLLHAGILARAQSAELDASGCRWTASAMTPGDDPLAELRTALAGLQGERRLLIVDQFEQLFDADDRTRESFLEELAGAVTLALIGLRADFYEAATREPLLLDALRNRQMLLTPMSEEEIRRAILEPARTTGVQVDEGLVDLLLAELAPINATNGFAHDAGALPLLSHSLLATWERSRNNRLTIAAYREAGGVRGAVRQSAEELYVSLTPSEQESARRMFCRLVRVEEGVPDTKRRVALSELTGAESARHSGSSLAAPAGESLLDRFVAARLLTVESDSVELTHEALLSAWPRLAAWLESDRAALRLHHQLTDAANAWSAAGGDPSLLLRGARLQLNAEWAGEEQHRGLLNAQEREFLDASLALAAAERSAARRRTRRMQQLLGAVTVLAVAAVALAVVAVHARRSADRARDEALSRQVAIEAGTLRRTDPALAMQLALVADRIFATTQATSALLDSSAGEMPTRLLGAVGPTAMSLDGGGSELAVAHSATDLVKVYGLTSGLPRLLATVHAGPSSAAIFAVALSPDGQLLAAGGTDQEVELWRLQRGHRPMALATLSGLGGTVYGLSFAPDGRTLAACDSAGTVQRWSLAASATPVREATLAAPGATSLQAVSYSPNGETIASAGADGKLLVWQATGDGRLLAVRIAADTTLTSLAFSPGGRTLAAGGQDALVHLWPVENGGIPGAQRAPLHGFANWVDSVGFSRDGGYLAAGDSDNSLRIWATSGWTEQATLTHPAPVTGLGFAQGDGHLVSVDEDGTTRIWSFPPPASYRTSGGAFSVDYTADGNELAAVSGGPTGDVGLWNVADPWRPRELFPVRVPGSFGPAAGVEALSPDGRLLAVGDTAGDVQLAEPTQAGGMRLLGPRLTGAVPNIDQLALSPDTRTLSVGDEAGSIDMWDIEDPSHPTRLPTLDANGKVGGVDGLAYSPNGRLLAAAGTNDRVWLWQVSDIRRPRLLAVLGGFTSYAETVAFTPNGRTLIAGSADDTVRLWNVSDPSRPRPLGPALRGPTSTVYDVAVSPDGDTLAAATTNQDVWLWNIGNSAKPRASAELEAASGIVYDVTFSPNGRTLVASGSDETLHFWDYRPAQVASRICALAGDPITRAEWRQYVPGQSYEPPCA